MLEQPEIRSLLRQRSPMLLLDRVVSVNPPESIVALKAVTISEPCYARLGEDLGIAAFAYPLALTIESFGQAVSILWALSGYGTENAVPLLAGLRDVVVHSSARPGDVLEHRVRLDHASAASWSFSGSTRSGDGDVLSVGSLLVVARPDDVLTGARRGTTG